MTHRSKLIFAIVIAMAFVISGTLYFTPQVAAPEERMFAFEIKDQALVQGPAVLSVNQGDKIKLHVKSDQASRLMIHGYDKELVVGGGGEATLTFLANQSGRFFIHLHGKNDTHVELAVLEVQPR